MPNYDYKCNECRIKFEINCSMSETKPTWKCPECNKPSSKIVTGFGIMTSKSYSSKKNEDVFIGQYAEKGWLEVEEKKGKIEKARRENPGVAVQLDENGEYQPMSKKTKTKRNDAYRAFDDALSTHEEKLKKEGKPLNDSLEGKEGWKKVVEEN